VKRRRDQVGLRENNSNTNIAMPIFVLYNLDNNMCVILRPLNSFDFASSH
jgi:hypothetical protein